MRVYAGSDHAGFNLRKNLVERLRVQGHEVVDLGPNSDGACDYPEFACTVGNAVRGDPGSFGILVCATGQGMAIAAGKVRGIRAVVPTTVEAARLSRFDNNANVLCLAGRVLPENDAFGIVDTWLATGFAGGRHARRIAKVAAIETASAVSFVTESERLRLAAIGIPSRIFERDPSLFSIGGLAHEKGNHGLGWLSLPSDMEPKLLEIASFLEGVRHSAFKDLVLLVENADRSAAVTVTRTLGSSGLVRLHVVDSGEVKKKTWLENPSGLDSTLVLVVLKSGTREEVEQQERLLWSRFYSHFGGDPRRAGQHFAAITTAGCFLAEIAKSHLYRKVFLDPDDVGDGFAALGFEGLVPAALFGNDAGRLLARTKPMVDACRGERLEENPGASLGILLGAMAKHGRYKLTLLVSKSLRSLVPWIAQILAGTTRNGGTGIVTLVGESMISKYPPDRIFVHLQADKDAPAIASEQMEALHIAGHPFIQIVVNEKYELGAEIFRWQMAATLAAIVLRMNPSMIPAPIVPMTAKSSNPQPPASVPNMEAP